jgi:hypothetical protein
MTRGGRERESLPVPAIARAHVGVHTADPPSPSLAPVSRIGDAACWQPCRKCGLDILVAYSGGLLVRASPDNLTVADELAARVAGRPTFDILMFGIPRRMYLEYRDIFRVRAPRRHSVVAVHRCVDDYKLLSGPVSNEVREIAIPYGNPLPDVPPF